MLSRLFRRLVLEKLDAVHRAGQLKFFGKHAALTNERAFAACLAPGRKRIWRGQVLGVLKTKLGTVQTSRMGQNRSIKYVSGGDRLPGNQLSASFGVAGNRCRF
jgi:hypothetical protein